MTYNATSLNIGRAIRAGLVLHEPVISFPGHQRALLVTPDLEKELRGEVSPETFSTIGVGILIRQFLSGQALQVSQKKRGRKLFRNVHVDFERLEKEDEIWVLCYRKPRPGFRFVGRFLEKDVLALFRVYDKHQIGNDYGPVIADVQAQWAARFGTQPPLRGNWIDTYLSGSHWDVDEKKAI